MFKTILLILCVGLLITLPGIAETQQEFSNAPKTNNGKKWRIGYHEGGEYVDYQKYLIATVQGLMDLGWIEQTKIPPQQGEQTKELWIWLADNAQSNYIEFVKDAYYSANWDDALRKKMTAQMIARLNQKKDIDLMIAAGTAGGKDLANDKQNTPTIVISASDPIASGIIKSVEDSGYDHLHASVDPTRFERQVGIFHDIIHFEKLGLAYENSPSGKVYAALEMVEKIARERGFEVVSCYTLDEVPDVKDSEASVRKCFEELGKKVDAIYVTMQNGVNSDSIPKLVEIANRYRIPTFSQSGSHEVKYGFLLSISQASYRYAGRFHAKTIAKVFNGAKPGQLVQLFEEPPKIAINLRTAEIIGYDPPVDVLAVADEIYEKIQKPEK
jgi:ABC-type uncharacterized transport system substrate-binding protein